MSKEWTHTEEAIGTTAAKIQWLKRLEEALKECLPKDTICVLIAQRLGEINQISLSNASYITQCKMMLGFIDTQLVRLHTTFPDKLGAGALEGLNNYAEDDKAWGAWLDRSGAETSEAIRYERIQFLNWLEKQDAEDQRTSNSRDTQQSGDRSSVQKAES